MTNNDLSQIIKAIDGAPNAQDDQVSRWRHGRRKPTRSMRLILEIATGGEVPVDSW